MKTKIIQALLGGESIQVNTHSINVDSKEYWVDLDACVREHYHFYASLFTNNDDYPLFRIKPKPEVKLITYRTALLKNSYGYYVFTVNNHTKAEVLEQECYFVKWLTDWISYNVESD